MRSFCAQQLNVGLGLLQGASPGAPGAENGGEFKKINFKCHHDSAILPESPPHKSICVLLQDLGLARLSYGNAKVIFYLLYLCKYL